MSYSPTVRNIYTYGNWLTILTFALGFMAWGQGAQADNFFAFVGSFISLDKQPYTEKEQSCEDTPADMECISLPMDTRYRARYKVLQKLRGSYSGNIVTFTVYDHRGEPEFARYRHALLYLRRQNGGYVHVKYAWSAMYPTNNGRYADCNEVYGLPNAPEFNLLKDIVFKPSVTFNLSHYSQRVVKRYADNPVFLVKQSTAQCVKGIYAEDLYRFEWPRIARKYR